MTDVQKKKCSATKMVSSHSKSGVNHIKSCVSQKNQSNALIQKVERNSMHSQKVEKIE